MDNPGTYDAVVIDDYGAPETLTARSFPIEIGPAGSAIVKVLATSINNVDLQLRSGRLGEHNPLPHAPGPDVVGIVEDCPDPAWIGRRVVVDPSQGCGQCRECIGGSRNRCTRFRILGEAVWGGYSSRIAVPMRNLIPIPDALETNVAACMPVTFGTAWRMLVGMAKVSPVDRVLVIGSGGGIAIAARRIARLHGSDVHVLARPSTKLDIAAEDACTVWPCTEAELPEIHRALRNAGGFDIVVDCTGGDWFAAGLKTMNVGGRLVTCGATVNPKTTIDLRPIFWKHLSIQGATGGTAREILSVLELAAVGKLKPRIDRVLPARKAAEGHAAIERGEVNGKIVLSWES